MLQHLKDWIEKWVNNLPALSLILVRPTTEKGKYNSDSISCKLLKLADRLLILQCKAEKHLLKKNIHVCNNYHENH